MANNEKTKKDKAPRDHSKAVVVVKVIALFTMILASLFMVGMLEVGQLFVQVLGYGLMVVTLYFALSIVK